MIDFTPLPVRFCASLWFPLSCTSHAFFLLTTSPSSLIPRRSTTDNLCLHSKTPASNCLSCYSLVFCFWKSYFPVSNHTSKPLFITVNTLRANCLLWERLLWHRQFKCSHKEHSPSTLFFICYVWFACLFFFLSETLGITLFDFGLGF